MTQSNFRLLAWDFDGTLADTRQDIALSVNLALEELGLRTLPPEDIYGFIGHGVVQLLSQSIEGTGYDDVEHAVEVFRRHYREHIMDHTVLYPGCREILDHFAGRTQTIVSNKPREFIVNIVRALKCSQSFATIVGGDDVEQRKPHPEALETLMMIYGVLPNQMLMIGDSLLDIECGRNAGAATCAVSWGLTPVEELEAANPDFLIHDMAELKSLVA